MPVFSRSISHYDNPTLNGIEVNDMWFQEDRANAIHAVEQFIRHSRVLSRFGDQNSDKRVQSSGGHLLDVLFHILS